MCASLSGRAVTPGSRRYRRELITFEVKDVAQIRVIHCRKARVWYGDQCTRLTANVWTANRRDCVAIPLGRTMKNQFGGAGTVKTALRPICWAARTSAPTNSLVPRMAR